jgi:hypothetical protein
MTILCSFCVLINLDIRCFPNSVLLQELWFHPCSFDYTVFWDTHFSFASYIFSMCLPYWNIFISSWNNTVSAPNSLLLPTHMVDFTVNNPYQLLLLTMGRSDVFVITGLKSTLLSCRVGAPRLILMVQINCWSTSATTDN